MARITEPSVQASSGFEPFRKWLVGSRRNKTTQLVTTGHVLNPPFDAGYEEVSGSLRITIHGQNDEFQISCNRIVLSRFRPNQVGFFTVDGEGAVQQRRFVATLSSLYQKILVEFPPGSRFSSSELYSKVIRGDGKSQSHARRRWKELKYNYGFEVDLTPDRQTYWRGKTEVPIRDPFLRPDDNHLRKVRLAQMPLNTAREYECNNCGVLVQFTGNTESDDDDATIDPFAPRKSRGLLDHRRPILQGGDDSLENLQVFCETCNNLKATTCNKCPYAFQCEGCMWAHPENVKENRVVLILDGPTADKIRSITGSNLTQGVEKILRTVDSKSKI